MAWYKYSTFFANSNLDEFDKVYAPGAVIAWSGIYRCEGCGHEIVHTLHHPLPSQNHHQHAANEGKIRWRLVATDAPLSS
jgi:hypothetical protein